MMKFFAALASLALFFAPHVAAVDYRELITIPSKYASGADFCTDFLAKW